MKLASVVRLSVTDSQEKSFPDLRVGSAIYVGWLTFLIATTAFAAEDTSTSTNSVADIVPFLIPSLEDKFTAEAAKADTLITKAEAEATKVKRIAADARLKGYKDKLTEVTKTGDFDKAQQVKARITQLENGQENESHRPSKRPRPKDTVRFGGHTYALVKEPVPWHVAKSRCEDMGGHLVVIDSVAEGSFVESLCTTTDWTWGGASDEESEGKWMWVTGKQMANSDWIAMDHSDEQHYLGYNRVGKKWHDCNEEHRTHFVCEWER